MPDTTVFGERLKQLRTKLKLSQRDFADKVGVTASALSSYEKGQKNPSVNVAINIATQFNVSLDWLCGIKNQSRFHPDMHIPFDLPAALSGLLYLIHYRLLSLPITEETEEYGVISADVLDVSNGILEEFIRNSEQLKDLYANGAISQEILEMCLSEMIYNTSDEIQDEEKRDYERRKKEREKLSAEREKLKDEECNNGSSPF